ncbi:MAG: AMP-binding protein [Actinomycetota bacterium]|nr:AMP-binding protein [Actinomycetota bacterium]
MAVETRSEFLRKLEERDPRLYMLAQLLSHRDVVSGALRAVMRSRFPEHKGLLSRLLELRAEDNPNRVGLIFENGGQYPDEKLTYARLYANSLRLAHAFRREGYARGDKIALVMRNHPEFVYAMAACTMLGTILVPIDPRAKREKLAYQLSDSDAVAVITTADLLPEVEEAAKGIPNLRKIYLNLKPDADPALTSRYPTVNEMLDQPRVADLEDRVDDPAAPVQIIYTSGVTGNPKGVTLDSRRNAMYCLLGYLVWGYRDDDILYTGLSLAHGNAQAVTLFPALTMGIPAVISQRFTKSRIWDICRRYGCTTFSLLGGMMSGIYNEPPRPDDADNPVRMVISAGTPRAIWEDFERRFGVQILEWYGAIEGGFAYKPIGEGPIGSFGKPIPGLVEMRVVDEEDNEVPSGVTGELICRMLTQTKVDYYKKPEASAEKMRGGWLRSGDMVHRDEEGWFFFDYRKGGALRRAGDFIKPDLVEKVIGEHPDVSEVCVYGIPAASGAPGESDLVAAVAPFPGKSIDPASVFRKAAEGLERNSIPSYLQVVDEIPKSPSEKHLDRVLRDQFSPDAENVYKLEDYLA